MLVEEKGEKCVFGSQILDFGKNSLFLLPVEENVPCAKKAVKSRGHSGEGAEPREPKREPWSSDLTGKKAIASMPREPRNCIFLDMQRETAIARDPNDAQHRPMRTPFGDPRYPKLEF